MAHAYNPNSHMAMFHHGMNHRQPLASMHHGTNPNVPVARGWTKEVASMPPSAGVAYPEKLQPMQQPMYASTPKANCRSQYGQHPSRASVPFKSPITLCFEQMLGAGKYRF